MCENVDDGKLHDGRQTNGRPHVVTEVKKCAAEGPQQRKCHTAQGSTHAMFPDTKMEVPSAIVASLKISRAFELKSGFVGSCQVSRATDQPRHILRHDVENFA